MFASDFLFEIVGWTGAMLLATCGLPQLWKTMRTKRFEGLSLLFVWWWFIGEILTIVFALKKDQEPALVFNYVVNALICIVILCMWWKYGRKSTQPAETSGADDGPQ